MIEENEEELTLLNNAQLLTLSRNNLLQLLQIGIQTLDLIIVESNGLGGSLIQITH